MCALAVISISSKLAAAQQYVDDHKVSVSVITETHVQEGGYSNIDIKGMARVGTCCRQAGMNKGGVATSAHETAP